MEHDTLPATGALARLLCPLFSGFWVPVAPCHGMAPLGRVSTSQNKSLLKGQSSLTCQLTCLCSQRAQQSHPCLCILPQRLA